VHPEGFFDFLLEKTPDQVYFKDRHGRFLRASRAVAEMLGVASAEDLIGKTDFDLWSAETAREAAADEQRIMETKEPLVGKIERLVHPVGRISNDRLGITAIYLNVTTCMLSMNTLRSGRGSLSSRLEILD
jgi:PAS domain S-box-containing protein